MTSYLKHLHHLKHLLLIAGGGAIGAVFRWWFSEFIHVFFDKSFPIGILLTNTIGSFFMGFFSIYLFHRFPDSIEWRSFLLIGLFGAFTTFSTFSLDTVKLIEGGQLSAALLNVLFSVVLCVAFAFLGVYLAENFI